MANIMDPHKDTAQRTLIVGLGATGLSCVRCLSREGVPLAVVDSREAPPGLDEVREHYPDLAVFLGGFDQAAFTAAECLVVSPGVSIHQSPIADLRQQGVPVIGDIELFVRRAQAPIVAITGSNGKTTTTHLVTSLLRAAGHEVLMGGNVGVPALSLLEQPVPAYYVLELSSFQLETTYSLEAAAAVLLNVTPDHMDRYVGFEDYAAAKGRIFRGCKVAVINRDDPVTVRLAGTFEAQISFGLDEPDDGHFGVRRVGAERYLCRGHELLLPISALRLVGDHNIANAAAALAAVAALNVPVDAVLGALRSFVGLPHRTQWVGERNGVVWINDSKGTNVGATAAAVRGLNKRVVLIAGGVGKGQDFGPLGPVLEGVARGVILIGEDGPVIARALGEKVPVQFAKTLAEAVAQADKLAQTGDAVLLSPACASFDMFKNYEDRGNTFANLVKERLQHGNGPH